MPLYVIKLFAGLAIILGSTIFFYLLSSFILWKWQTIEWQTVRLLIAGGVILGLMFNLD